MPAAPKASAAKNRPYSGRPRQRSQAPGPGEGFDAPTPAERRRMDADQARPYREAYEAGRKAGAAGKATGGKGSAAKKAPAKRTDSSSKRRAAPGSRSLHQAARSLQAPVRQQFTSGLRLLGMALGLAALYAVLNAAPAVSGVLGGLSKALDWLGAPRGVPARG